MSDRIEIRMFGRFFVRRANGEIVADDEWSTGKTADLLRILALTNGRPVPVSGLLEKLWPGVNDDKARASLRTAASRIRRALGSDSIDRNLSGLALRNAWVDVVAYKSLVLDARVAATHAHDYSRVVSIVRESESLYVSDFRAHDGRGTWAIEVRESLRMTRQSMLADAAESAVSLLWMRDAIDFATLAIASDPCFERPHRSLMRAHAGLGEIELALRAFERCRVNLSRELGADPSPQTRALHLQLISGDITDPSPTPFTGRQPEVQNLAALLANSMASDTFDVICLRGQPGSGRMALLRAAAAAMVPRVQLRHVLHEGPTPYDWQLLGTATSSRSVVAVLKEADGDPEWESSRMVSLLNRLTPRSPKVIVIVTSATAGDLLETKLADTPVVLHQQSTGPISDADLATLAANALSGPATPRLLAQLREQSQGLAGTAFTIIREWIASGWVISTQSGLDLYNDAAAMTGIPPVGDTFRTLLEQLKPQEMDFCLMLTVVGHPVTASIIDDLRTKAQVAGKMNVDEIQLRLDVLNDLGILRYTRKGYVLRNLAIRDAFQSWFRPSVKTRLLREFADITATADRADQT